MHTILVLLEYGNPFPLQKPPGQLVLSSETSVEHISVSLGRSIIQTFRLND